jgi:hypothetical protein
MTLVVARPVVWIIMFILVSVVGDPLTCRFNKGREEADGDCRLPVIVTRLTGGGIIGLGVRV